MLRLVTIRLAGFISLFAAWPLLEDVFSQAELPVNPVSLLLGFLLLGFLQPSLAQAQTAPTSPKNLVAKPSNSSVALTWTASSGATSYKVFRSTTSNSYSTPLSSSTSPSYADSTAVNNTTYYYVVKATKAGVDSVNSSQVSARPKAPPTAVTLNNPTATIVNGAPSAALTWTKNTETNFGSYKIYRGLSSGVTPQNGTLLTTITNANTLSYTDSSVVVAPAPGTKFYYMVAVTDSIAQVSPSAEKSITLVNTATAPTAVTLNAPTAGYDDTSIQLSWSQSSEPYFASYKIYRRTSPGVTPQNGTLISTQTDRNATYFYDSGLTPAVAPGTTYYYIVVVANNANLSTPSLEKSLPLINAPPVAVTLNTPYGDGYDEGGGGDNDYSNPNGAQLSWTQSYESDFASYKIYRRTSPGVTPQNGVLVATVANSNETYSYDSGALATVAPGVTYYYIIVVTDAAGQTAASNETSILRLNKVPSAVTLAPPTVSEWEYDDKSVQLSWSQSYKWDFASYKIYRGIAPGVTAANGTLVTTITQGDQIYYSDSAAKGSIAPGTTYYYVVAVTDAAGQTALSNEQSLTQVIYPPAIPTDFVATAGDTQVVLSWSAATGATSYKLFRSTTSGSYSATPLATLGTETSYTDSNLPNNTRYYYILIANNADGDSANSTEASATPSLPLPPAPTHFVGIPGDAKVALSWSASSGATSYKLFRSMTDGTYDFTSPLNTVTTTSYMDTGVTNGVTYFYVVRAVNADGGTGASSASVAAVPAAQIGFPANLKAVASDGAVTLTWDRAARATAYQVKRKTASLDAGTGAWGAIGQTDALSFIDSSVTNGTTYSYVVVPLGNARTVNQNNTTNTIYDEGPSSDVVDATPNALAGATPTTPSGLVALAGAGRIDLRWVGSSGATSYEVARATSSSGPFTALAPTTQSNVYSDINLANGTTYYYQVTAIGASGARSAPTAPVAATPNALLPVASNFTATGGNGQVALSWDSVAGASAYWIYRSIGASAPPTLIEQAVGTSYVDTEVINGRTYYYTLRTSNVVAGSVPVLSGGATATATPIGVPVSASNLRAIAGDAKVQLLWDGGARGSSYEIWWQTGTGAWSKKTTITAAVAGSPPSTIVTGLTNGTIYGFLMRVINSGGAGADSNVANAVPWANVPEKPGDITIQTTTKTSITVVPPALSFGADSLNIYTAPGYRAQQEDVLTPVALNVTSQAPLTVSGLIPGQTYTFRAVAVNVNGATSGDITSADTASDTAPAGAPATPAAPSFGSIGYDSPTQAQYIKVLGVMPLGASSLVVQWKLAAGPDSDFDLPDHQVAMGEGNYLNYGEVRVTPLVASTTYTFRLVASNDSGSTTGPVASATTLPDLPDAPPMPTSTGVTDNSITLIVPLLPARATGLDLNIESDDFSPTFVLRNVAPGSVTIPYLSSGTTYTFWWGAKNAAGVTIGLSVALATTGTNSSPLPPAPVFQNLTETGLDVVTIPMTYDASVSLSLQMKLTGAPDAAYQTLRDNIEAVVSPDGGLAANTITPVTGLTPGQSYNFRYLAHGYNTPTVDQSGPAATITLPTATTTWSSGAPIACPGIRSPQPGLTIRAGTIGKLSAGAAVDWDVMTRTVNGWGISRAETDTCTYTWSASAGSFPDGNMGETVRWQAPFNSSATVNFSLTVSDQGNRNKGVAEVGNRGDTMRGGADAPLHFTTMIQVVP